MQTAREIAPSCITPTALNRGTGGSPQRENKKPATRGRGFGLVGFPVFVGLSLGELEASAGAALAVLFAFLHAAVAGKEERTVA